MREISLFVKIEDNMAQPNLKFQKPLLDSINKSKIFQGL